jgi:hypothetical protein
LPPAPPRLLKKKPPYLDKMILTYTIYGGNMYVYFV